MELTVTLGEYIRRQRRGKDMSLMQVSEETGISYSHLSRIENDSTLPSTDHVVKLAEALDGDLKLMLTMSNALPRQILDRMTETASTSRDTTLLRAANMGGGQAHLPDRVRRLVALLESEFGFDGDQAVEVARGIEGLTGVHRDARTLLVSLMQSLGSEGGGRTG